MTDLVYKMAMGPVTIELWKLDIKYADVRVRRRNIERRLLVSLEEEGQKTPVVVVPAGADGRYVVIDGHKRVRALRKLKRDVVEAVVWEKDEAEGLATSYEASRRTGWNAFEEGRLVEELHRRFRWSMGDVAKRLLRSKSWASRRLSLVEGMPGWLAEEVSAGRVGVHAAVTYLAALTRVNDGEGAALAQKLCELSLTNRQVRDVCEHYRRAAPDVRRRITADPLLFLKAQQAAAGGGMMPAADKCLKNIVLAGNILLGLTRAIPEAWGLSGPEGRKPLGAAWEGLCGKWALLTKTMEAVNAADRGGRTVCMT